MESGKAISTDVDAALMRRALDLASRAWGATSPNPMVGAVVIRDGAILGEGWHHQAGHPHAEVEALRACVSSADGATLYVTLEPCCTHGRTPPCVDAILSAGVTRVVVGCLDPNPLHSGEGIEILRGKGVAVDVGVEEQSCAELNEAFFKWITTGEPFVLLKLGATLDGRIATASGQSKWITCPEARERVMRLRQWADAVMVGGQTVRADHPSLTVRSADGTLMSGWRQPRRLVATRSLDSLELKSLMGPGMEPEPVRADSAEQWREMLRSLGAGSVTSLLVEGGGELAASLLAAKCVDKVEFHFAPMILGGNESKPMVGGASPERLADACRLERVRHSTIGSDILISGYPAK